MICKRVYARVPTEGRKLFQTQLRRRISDLLCEGNILYTRCSPDSAKLKATDSSYHNRCLQLLPDLGVNFIIEM